MLSDHTIERAGSYCSTIVTRGSCGATNDSVNTKPHTAIAEVLSSKPGCSSFKSPYSSFMRSTNKKHRSDIPEHIERTMDSLKSLKAEVQKREVVNDFSHFSHNIASQLRPIPLADALECQLEIMRIIQQ